MRFAGEFVSSAVTINACLASADVSLKLPMYQAKVAPAPAASLTHRPPPAARAFCAFHSRVTISFNDTSSFRYVIRQCALHGDGFRFAAQTYH